MRVQPAIRPSRRSFRPTPTEVLASVGVLVAAMALIALVWINEARTVANQRNELRASVEATVGGQALVLADEVRREMLALAQSLTVIKHAFEADPQHFDMSVWRAQMPALMDTAEDVFIADNHLIIQHDINPASVGLGVGANIGGMFGPETDKGEREELVIGPAVMRVRDRQHLSFIMMRLDHPGGWIIGATYRTDTLTRMYAEASLGEQGMTALINTRLGRVQAVAGPAAGISNYEIAKSEMYAAMRERPDGTWIGPSAPDGVQRIHGFHRVPGRDLSVVVAVDTTEAMRPAIGWAGWARSVAWWATVVILAGVALAMQAIWTYRTKRRLRQSLDREQVLLANTQLELAEMRTRVETRATQLHALFAGIDEGALVIDAEMRVTEWNRPLPSLLGLVPEFLQSGMPLDDMLRGLAREGLFGAFDDMEVEVARRMAQLRAGGSSMSIMGAGDRRLEMLSGTLPDGGLIIVVRDQSEATPDQMAPHVLESSPVEEA